MLWLDLAGTFLKAGLPAIGKALAGDTGAEVGRTVAEALGTEPTPEAVRDAVANDPSGAAAALASVEAQIEQARASVAIESTKQVNETMRAELALAAGRPDGWWSAWRTQLAQMLVVECPVWVLTIVVCLFTSKVADLMQISGLIMTWWSLRFGAIGVHMVTGSAERKAAITGQGSILGTVVNAVVNRKK